MARLPMTISPVQLPPEAEPPRLAIATKQTAETCVECGTIVVLNYLVHLGMVYCMECAKAEEHL